MARLYIKINDEEVCLRDRGLDEENGTDYWTGCCPYCDKASFCYYEEKKYFSCYGCGKSGFYREEDNKVIGIDNDLIKFLENYINKNIDERVSNHRKYINNEMTKVIENFEKKIEFMNSTLINYSSGLQNVYDEFNKIKELIDIGDKDRNNIV